MFDLGRVLSRAFHVSWHHKWLWVLGVFGGAGGFNFSYRQGVGKNSGNAAQLNQFIADHLALVLLGVALILVLAVVGVVLTCIAVPASIWAGLQLDAGQDVGLRRSWRAGRGWGWRYFRLGLLKAVIALALVAVLLAFIVLGVGLYAVGGAGTIPILFIGGLLVVVAFVAALVVYGYGVVWSDRLLVILDTGAGDALRNGWWLMRQEKGNTFIFSLAFGLIKFGISIAVFLAVLVIAAPGIVMAAVYFTSGAPLALGVIGIAWIAFLGLGALLVGGGYVGALNQVGYAIAARDLAIGRRMAVRSDVIGYDPYPAELVPAP